MIDTIFKKQMDALWAPLGRGAARLGLTPNVVTVLGTVLCAGNAAAFVWHRQAQVFAAGLLLFEALDNVDGALARFTGRCTAMGAYLDSVADRYKDAFAIVAVGSVTGYWLACVAWLAGAQLVSYSQARSLAAGVAPQRGRVAPIFERLERVVLLALGLFLAQVDGVLLGTLWLGAVLGHLTAAQRIWGACRALRAT